MGRALNPDITLCFKAGDAGGQLLSSFVRTPRLLKFPQTSRGVHCTQLYPRTTQTSRKTSNPSDDKGLGHFKFRAPAGREREEVCEHLRDAGALCTYVTQSLKLHHNPEQCLGLGFVQTGVSLLHESKKYQVTEKSPPSVIIQIQQAKLLTLVNCSNIKVYCQKKQDATEPITISC